MDEEQKRLAEELLSSEGIKPGFAKALSFGILEPLAPPPRISNVEKEANDRYLEKLNVFLDKNLDAAAIDKAEQIPTSLIEGLAEIGLLGMTVPKKYGGLGMSQQAYCRAIEAVASRCGATAVFINAHQSIGLKGLLLFGTEEQKTKWLPDLAAGKKIAAFSLTEPKAGSDANGIETHAEYDTAKNVWRINGSKQWTTNGSIAEMLIVMAKTEVQTKRGKEKKVTAFIVTPDMPGFTVTNPALEKVGIRGTRTTNLDFKNVEVPPENILGPIGSGLKVCLTCLDYGRTTFGAMCTGASKYATHRAIEHAKTRYQFNRPLASFPLVKQKIAKMTALTYAMDATTYMTAGLIDGGVEDVMIEAAILKVFASESLWETLYDTMQIFGGRSFFTSEPFERMMRDARLNMIGEGSNEVLRVFIPVVGMREVALHLKASTDGSQGVLSILGLIPAFLRNIFPATFKTRSVHFRKEGKNLEKAVKRFGRTVFTILATYKEEFIEQQLILNRLSDCLISIYTIAAVLSKIDTALSNAKDDINSLQYDVETAKLYCKMAFAKIQESRNALENNFDKNFERLSDRITGL